MREMKAVVRRRIRSEQRWVSITSPHNPLLKTFRRAAHDAEEFCVAEGPRLLEEAWRAGVSIQAVLLTEPQAATALDKLPREIPVYRVSRSLFDRVATTEAPQGVAALIRRPTWAAEQLFAASAPLVVVLDGIQDPGNVGTILRSAAAFGASGAILLSGTADPFNPKALRASAGAAFRLPSVTRMAPKQAISLLREHQVRILACMARDVRPLVEVTLAGSLALAIGSEARGLSREMLEGADERISVPMRPETDSLNAGMAASIVLYEVARQRGFRF